MKIICLLYINFFFGLNCINISRGKLEVILIVVFCFYVNYIFFLYILGNISKDINIYIKL